MWPRREILILIPPHAEGVPGIEELLKALEIRYVLKESPAAPVKNSGFVPIEELEKTPTEKPSVIYPTELVYLPGISEEDPYRKWACEQSLPQQEIGEFLHSLWGSEIVLSASVNSILLDGYPLLWVLLEESGFEPSLLWPKSNGTWLALKQRGLQWVVPDIWFQSLAGKNIGRLPLMFRKELSWVRREKTVDFYLNLATYTFLGSLPRWPEVAGEEAVYDTVAQALKLGVSWTAVLKVLKPGTQDYPKVLRWSNDLARDTGPFREELSPAGFEHLENRWSGGVGLLAGNMAGCN